MDNISQSKWRFGTAGFRAPMGLGDSCFNRDSVSQIAYAIGNFLKPQSSVVIGFDARHHSEEFALLTAQVLDALGHKSLLFPRLVPTPICAFAVTELNAAAGIMITASHNPAGDNGVKVYGPEGAQLIAPDTHLIESILEQAPKQITLSDKPIQSVSEEIINAYFKKLPRFARNDSISIIYTPMHGVGAEYALKALNNAGFDNILVVESQAKPDGDFPTVKFPNPEEPGALDLAI
ncbi:MAG: phospho-sugar mutase, partial [Myxococcaceae bacterium]